jgi:hypothetical protein
MAVVARMRVQECAATEYGTKVKLGAIYTADEKDPHYKEIKSFWESTPTGTFEAMILNAVAAEQFQPGMDFYITLTPCPT